MLLGLAGIAAAATVAAGDDHTCAIAGDAVWCWGEGRFSPVKIAGTEGATSLSAGADHTCATLGGSRVACFRIGGDLVTIGNAKVVSAGDELTCSVDGKVGCVGSLRTEPPLPPPPRTGGGTGMGLGGLGTGSFGPRPEPKRAPPPSGARVPVDVPATDLAAGDGFVCGRAGGVVSCVGRDEAADTWHRWTLAPKDVRLLAVGRRICVANAAGAVSCGVGSSALAPVWTAEGPLTGVDAIALGGELCARKGGAVWCADDGAVAERVPGLDDAVEVAVGKGHACATRATGAIACWGSGSTGALGTGVDAERPSGVVVPGLTDAVSIAAGTAHSCAARKGGPPVCWGSGPVVGAGGPGRPGEVAGVGVASRVVSGEQHACALTAAGVRCWGADAFGQLGDGEGRPPTRVLLPKAATDFAVGGSAGCALVDGRPWCWGDRIGTLGLDPDGAPAPVLLDDVAKISVASDAACAVRRDGTVWCWGTHYRGLIGPRDEDTLVPVRIEGVEGAVAVGVDFAQACAVTRGGRVSCWGEDGLRAVGNVEGAVGIAVGSHACAWDGNGAVRCWGYNDRGQLGVSPDEVEHSDDAIAWKGPAAAQVSVGDGFTCVRHRDGTASCFGDPAGAAFGDGESTGRDEFVDWSDETGGSTLPRTGKPKLAGIADLDGTCAATSAGEVRCWAIDDPDAHRAPLDRVAATPIRIEGLPAGGAVPPDSPGVVQVRVGGDAICARTKAGEVWCWGVAEHGALGDGSAEGRRAAVAVQGLPATPTQLVAGGHTTCGVAKGATWCWGWNPVHDERDHDDDDPLTSGFPGTIGVAGTPRLLAMGEWGGCAAKDGAVDCFGMGVGESLGPDRVEIPEDQRWAWPAPPPAPDPPPAPAVAEAGLLGLLGTDVSNVFGPGGLGQIGLGGELSGAFGEGGLGAGVSGLGSGPGSGSAPAPKRHGPMHAVVPVDAVQIATGPLASCAVDRAGALKCWGTLDDPAVHPIATGVAQVSVGDELGCFVRKAGTVACWTRSTPPGDVAGVDKVAEVAVGKDHACGRRTDGTVVCWGNNGGGAVGPGAPVSETPVAVVGLP